MTAPLDLRAVEARLNDLYHETGTPGAIIDVEALLSHACALRAALRMHVCHRDGYLPACVQYSARHQGAHRPECAQSVAVLAAAREGPA